MYSLLMLILQPVYLYIERNFSTLVCMFYIVQYFHRKFSTGSWAKYVALYTQMHFENFSPSLKIEPVITFLITNPSLCYNDKDIPIFECCEKRSQGGSTTEKH